MENVRDLDSVEMWIWLCEDHFKRLQRYFDECKSRECRDNIALRMEELEKKLELLHEERRRIFAECESHDAKGLCC
jgi:hypothetical protein